MACLVLVVILSLLCLLQEREYWLNQRASSSSINETLSSEVTKGETPSIG